MGFDYSGFAGRRPRVAVHKFSSCDGCQLAFLNAGEALLAVSELVEFVHFAEAGPVDPDAPADIAFIEGSVSTPEERERLEHIRAHSGYLISIGACATSGGLQALRNLYADGVDAWRQAVYASPEYVASLDTATPVAEHVKVDLEIWGCPVNTAQVVGVLHDLLHGVQPTQSRDKVCLECKRQNAVCVMVAKGMPCMGPVTQTGCGAICPRYGRDCYACYGPAETVNTDALGQRLGTLGLQPGDVTRRFHFINSHAPAFRVAGNKHRSE
ncbi:MAG: sulfhydrogenase subunit delta [Chromatiales bacterium]|nr:sulfhydrogenase subunit delta [Chromatiales bacterium]